MTKKKLTVSKYAKYHKKYCDWDCGWLETSHDTAPNDNPIKQLNMRFYCGYYKILLMAEDYAAYRCKACKKENK